MASVNRILSFVIRADGHPAILLVRLAVGAMFLSEGIQKFLYPDALGVERFTIIGFAKANVIAPIVGVFEIVCGTLVLVGRLTRAAALPLFAIMLTALVTTKLPILLGRDVGPFQVRSLEEYGVWAMAHESRTDWAMLLAAPFLAIVGAGRWSFDRWLTARRRQTTSAVHL